MWKEFLTEPRNNHWNTSLLFLGNPELHDNFFLFVQGVFEKATDNYNYNGHICF